MRFEKYISRENGDKIKFTCTLYIEIRENYKPYWGCGVQIKHRGKRKWLNASINDYTEQEKKQALLEYWESLKPKIITKI